MRTLAFLFLAAGSGIFNRSVESVDFDKLAANSAPSGWTFAQSHRGAPGRWVIHPDANALSTPNVLAQLGTDRSPGRIALALYDKGYCKNGDLSADMKIVSGKSTQTGGLVWRYQDPDNYYLLEVSADRDLIAVIRMQDGKASPVVRLGPGFGAQQVSHKIDPMDWNVLRVTFQNSRMTVYFDHRKVMDADDSMLQKPGKTGLWTRGDTVAYFDNFRIDKKKD